MGWMPLWMRWRGRRVVAALCARASPSGLLHYHCLGDEQWWGRLLHYHCCESRAGTTGNAWRRHWRGMWRHLEGIRAGHTTSSRRTPTRAVRL